MVKNHMLTCFYYIDAGAGPAAREAREGAQRDEGDDAAHVGRGEQGRRRRPGDPLQEDAGRHGEDARGREAHERRGGEVSK